MSGTGLAPRKIDSGIRSSSETAERRVVPVEVWLWIVLDNGEIEVYVLREPMLPVSRVYLWKIPLIRRCTSRCFDVNIYICCLTIRRKENANRLRLSLVTGHMTLQSTSI